MYRSIPHKNLCTELVCTEYSQISGGGAYLDCYRQLAYSEFFKIMELLYFICTLNLTLTLTLSNIGSV